MAHFPIAKALFDASGGTKFTFSKIFRGFGTAVDIYSIATEILPRQNQIHTPTYPMKTLALLLLSITMLASPVQQTNAATESAKKDPAGETAKSALKPYPLDTCLVSGEKLGEMGKPISFEYKGQEIKICCKACRKKFDKDPATYLKKLEPKK